MRKVEYLLIGGYAVAYYGLPRATAVMDVWVDMSPRNAEKIVHAIKDFGFDVEELKPELFLNEDQIIRMVEPPMRIEGKGWSKWRKSVIVQSARLITSFRFCTIMATA